MDFEPTLLAALIQGKISPRIVDEQSLSPLGIVVVRSIDSLIEKGYTEISLPDLSIVCREIYKADSKQLGQLLTEISKAKVTESTGEILSILHNRRILKQAFDLIGRQIASGDINKQEVLALLQDDTEISSLEPLAASVSDDLPATPTGVAIKSLPLITEATGGLFGFWVIGGETGEGKTTLAWQMALDFGRNSPVLYYDLDASGAEALRYRTHVICQSSTDRQRKALRQVFTRDSINRLEQDLQAIKSPALVVIDSLQTLPTHIDPKQRRMGLDQWIMRLKGLVQRGYCVLCVSEISRWSYGEARLSGFKETGEIEYGASLACRMLLNNDALEFHILKNRHRPNKGMVAELVRDNERVFWYKEREREKEAEPFSQWD